MLHGKLPKRPSPDRRLRAAISRTILAAGYGGRHVRDCSAPLSPEAPWPPRVGDLLPRAGEAYAQPQKLAWILSNEGHGREWARVLRIGPHDTERFWEAIARAAIGASIHRVADKTPDGVVCGAKIDVAIDTRMTTAVASWHYEHALADPRLVTAYPSL